MLRLSEAFRRKACVLILSVLLLLPSACAGPAVSDGSSADTGEETTAGAAPETSAASLPSSTTASAVSTAPSSSAGASRTTARTAGRQTTASTARTVRTTVRSLPALTVYPVPEGLEDNVRGSFHTVKVNGKESFVYQTEVTVGSDYLSGYAEYTSFDFTGSVSVEVTAAYAVSSVEILPSRDAVAFKQTGNTVTFTLKKAGQYFVKLNGTEENGNTAAHPLYIFANRPSASVPDKNDRKVVYFEPGVYFHQVYYLSSNTTYYLAPGAFVYGRFYGVGLENVTICGRGVICGEELTSLGDDGRTVCIKKSKNVRIEGVTVVHPKVWTVAIYESSDVHIDNIKTISHGMSSDGCDIVACRDALVENSFFRAHDDILAVKASTMSDYTTRVSCENVTFRNCVAWCDSSNPMTIGYETVGDVKNITYENIDVLNQSRPPVWRLEAIMAIEPHYTGTVDGVTYRDIRIDVALADDPESLFRFVIDDGSGTIRNVRVENVFVNYGGALTGKIQGSTKAKNIDGVTFVNVRNSRGERLSMSHISKDSLVSHLSIQ